MWRFGGGPMQLRWGERRVDVHHSAGRGGGTISTVALMLVTQRSVAAAALAPAESMKVGAS